MTNTYSYYVVQIERIERIEENKDGIKRGGGGGKVEREREGGSMVKKRSL